MYRSRVENFGAHETTSVSRMLLALFYTPVGTRSAWRRPRSGVEELYQLQPAVRAAQAAEAAGIDALLFGDVLEFSGSGRDPDLNGYEPISLAAAVAAHTVDIGVVATASTTFSEPYSIARLISGIDHLSSGRAGWNVVTSRVGARNHSLERMPSPESRYLRADEFLDVVTKLWGAWHPDAVLNDRDAGIWASDSKIDPILHKGPHFHVEGPLTTPSSPQGQPVIFQAGQSEPGRALAARWADVVFTAQTDIASARRLRADIRARAEDIGRDPDSIKILPGVGFVFGSSNEDAAERDLQLSLLAGESRLIAQLSAELGGIDLDGLGLKDRIPPDRLRPPPSATATDSSLFFEGSTSRYMNLFDAALKGARIQDLIRNLGGHRTLVGTPTTVAEEMELWFRSGACDGFVVSPRYMPEGLDIFLSEVVPDLRRRGVFERQSPGKTLRERVALCTSPCPDPTTN